MPTSLMSGARTVTNTITTASSPMFCRTSSSGPENRSAARLMPAVSTLIKFVEHMTTSNTNAAEISAMMWSIRWALVRRKTVGQRAHCTVMLGARAGTVWSSPQPGHSRS